MSTMHPRPVFAITISTVRKIRHPCNTNRVRTDSFFRRHEPPNVLSRHVLLNFFVIVVVLLCVNCFYFIYVEL